MNRRHFVLAAAAVAAGCAAEDAVPSAAEGTRLYRAGRFPEAGRVYRKVLDDAPDDVEALAGAGAVALLGNRLDEATAWLTRALERQPDHRRAREDLAEAAYRRDDFAAAAQQLRRGGGANNEVIARKLEAFRNVTPYRIEGAQEARVPFVITDPLPVVTVTVGGRTVPFFIDTGGHEIYLDQGLATELGLETFGTTRGAGAGGKQADEGHARLDSITLGELRVHDLPVKLLDFAALGFAAALGGVPVKGVVGTAFLYHFLSTVDYVRGELVLRPRSATPAGPSVEFWLSGTHFIVTWGRVNGGDPTMLFADTGGAGIGFVATKATVERSGIALRHDQAIEGAGAGGTTKAVPFVLDRLALGDFAATDLPGVYFPETDLERDLERDFPLGGIVSHQFFRSYALTLDFTGMRLHFD